MHDAGTGRLITLEALHGRGNRSTRPQQSGAATGNHTLLDGRTGRRQGVLDAVLLLLELHLSGCTDLDNGHAAGQLGQSLLELLAVPVGIGLFDLTLDLTNATFDVARIAGSVDDGRLVLGDHNLAGRAHHVEAHTVELESDLLGNDLTTGEDGHVLEHCLTALAEARGLDGHRVEGATDLVDDQRGQGLALDVLGDDQQRATRLHDLLEHREHVLHRADLALVEEDVRLFEDRLLALWVGHEVRRQVALVELHALDEVEIHAERVGLLHGHDAVLTHLVDGVGDDLADRHVGSRNGGHVGDLLLGVIDPHRLVGNGADSGGHGGLDALLEAHRVGAGGHVAKALADQRLGQHGGGGGAVSSDVVGLGGHLLHQLGTHVLEAVLQLHLTGDGYAVVGDGGGAELLVEDHVAALGAEGDLDGVGQLVHAGLEAATGLFIKLQDFCHGATT